MVDGAAEADLEQALERAESDLRTLAGDRLLVTGGTGFVGSWLLEVVAWGARRLGLDLRVTVLTRSPEAWAKRRPHLRADATFTVCAGDVRTFAPPPGTFAAVVLGAASSDDAWTSANPVAASETIVEGTRHTLAVAEERAASRLLLLSSGAVHDLPMPTGALAEETSADRTEIADGRAAYAQAKRTAESLVAGAAGAGRRAVIARIFSVYGPHLPLDTHFAIGNFVRDAVRGRPVTVRGDGTPVRSYLYGSDLAVALLACLARGTSGVSYDVGGTEPITVGDLARLVASFASPPVAVSILGEHQSAGRYVPDTARLAADLGFEPAVSLAQGVPRMMQWARGQVARD